MPQLLVRDVPEETRENIAVAAHAAGRSMQSELLAALQEKYATKPGRPLIDILLSAGGQESDEDFAVIRDTPVRDFSF